MATSCAPRKSTTTAVSTLENTEAELARRVAVVTNREEAMQSWEGRILSREHDVADREASVNYHANRIARDAGSFEAVKHLLRQHYRTAEGRDRLQALVGIDDKAAELLKTPASATSNAWPKVPSANSPACSKAPVRAWPWPTRSAGPNRPTRTWPKTG